MSLKAVGWALEQQVGSQGAKLVLLGYAEHADRATWVSWPSRSTVARYAECEVRQAHRYHSHLVEVGLIEEADIDELPDELRGRYEIIRADHRPKIWRLNPTESRGVIPDTASSGHGVSPADTPPTEPRDVTSDMPSGESRGVISDPTGCHTGSSRGVTRDTRTNRRTVNKNKDGSGADQRARRDYLDVDATSELLDDDRNTETMPAEDLLGHVADARPQRHEPVAS